MCGRYPLGLDDDEIINGLEEIFGHADGGNASGGEEEQDDDDDNDGGRIRGLRGGAHAEKGKTAALESASKGKETADRVGEKSVTFEWDPIAKAAFRPRYNVSPTTQCVVVTRADALHHKPSPSSSSGKDSDKENSYTLHLMKWGLIPRWSKEPPTKPLHTINARIETINANSGLWNSVRDKNRCIVVAQGFYEWLAKGKTKLPHLTRIKSDALDSDSVSGKKKEKLMVMAGFWDHCEYKGDFGAVDSFTIITVPSNKQLHFLHDRMPALLSDPSEIALWLSDAPWSPRIEALIRPYQGKLDVYPVSLEVGKVGNDSPDFLLPIAEKKGSLASFFSSQSQPKSSSPTKPIPSTSQTHPVPSTSTAPKPSLPPSPSKSKPSKVAPASTSKVAPSSTSTSEKRGISDFFTKGSPEKKFKVEEKKSKKVQKKEAKEEQIVLSD